VGERFGPYELVEELGRGGMGVVWRARHTTKNREVALKRIRTDMEDAEFVERFRREQGVASLLPHHANVVPIIDHGIEQGELYIALAYIAHARHLGMRLTKGRLAPSTAFKILQDVADGLDAVHAIGLLHRDVKPSNILVTELRGRPLAYLIDFGICRRLDDPEPTLTAPGTQIGTPPYMAPERGNGRSETTAVDVYALACVLHQALTGRRPFEAQQPSGTRPPELADFPREWPRLADVLRSGLDPRPDQRPASAGELVEAARAAYSADVADGGRRGDTLRETRSEADEDAARQQVERDKARAEAEQREARRQSEREQRRRARARRRQRIGAWFRTTGRSWGKALGVLVAVVAIGGAAYVYWPTAPPREPGIEIPGGPVAVTVTPDGRNALLPGAEDGTLSIVDLDSRTVAPPIRVGAEPTAVAVRSDGRIAYVANSGADTVSVVDLETRTVTATIGVGAHPSALALTDAGDRLYVSNRYSSNISVIDTGDPPRVVRTFAVNYLDPDEITGLDVTADGSRLLVGSQPFLPWLSDGVAIVDVQNGRVTEVDVPNGPEGVVVDAAGSRAYVATTEGVSVIDIPNAAKATDVAIDGSPTGVVLSTDGRRVLVVNGKPGPFSVIDTTRNVATTIASEAGTGPLALVPGRPEAVVLDTGSATLRIVQIP
jgi:YVTN family beta-propeller protein